MIDTKADPLSLAVAAFAAGIAGIRYHKNVSDALLVSLAAGLAGLGLYLHYSFRQKYSWVAIIPFFFILGAFHTKPYLAPPKSPDHIYNLIRTREEVVFSGLLTTTPAIFQNETRLTIAAEVLHQRKKDIPAMGMVRLTLKGPFPQEILPGDRLRLKAVLSPVSSYKNPGTFDYQTYLAYEGIWISGWINNPLNIIKVSELVHPDLIEQITTFPERVRFKIITFLNNSVTDRFQGLYKAILVGEQTNIPADLRENFTKTGCVHMLSISGMHMGLLALFFIGIIAWLIKRSTWLILHIPVWKVSKAIALLPLTGYAFIAGLGTPVIRSLLMVDVVIIATIINREGRLLTNIAMAALTILVWQPTSLYTVSFQLSFAAVLAIALLYEYRWLRIIFPTSSPHQAGHKEFIKKWLFTSLAVSLAAGLGTAPLVIYHFNRLSLISPLANLVVEPFLCLWSLIVGLVAIFFIPLAPRLASTLFSFGTGGLWVADKITAGMAALPFSSVWMVTPSPIEIFLFYALFVYGASKQSIRPALPWITGAILLLMSLPLISVMVRNIKTDITVTFLDVGQGNATVIELPAGHIVLIDGGGFRSERFNVGEQVIAPFLWQRRITKVDDIIITHPHSDHFNGLDFIIARFGPERIWINNDANVDPGYQELIDQARGSGAKILVPGPETMIYEKNEVQITTFGMLETSDPLSKGPRPSINDASLVSRLLCGGASFLLPGDIGKMREKELLAAGRDLGATVLLAPHHGDEKANEKIFLQAVAPRYLVVSAGRYNRFGFPAPELLTLAKEYGITVLTTATEGAITFTSNGKALSTEGFSH